VRSVLFLEIRSRTHASAWMETSLKGVDPLRKIFRGQERYGKMSVLVRYPISTVLVFSRSRTKQLI